MTYKANSEATTMNRAVRSLYLISSRVELTKDEAQAIVARDGIYPVSGGVVVDAGYAEGELTRRLERFKLDALGTSDVTLHAADIVRTQGRSRRSRTSRFGTASAPL